MVQRYLNKISGPLLDRIDLHVEVTPVSYDELATRRPPSEGSGDIAQRVVRAREIQQKRYGSANGIYVNAQMSSRFARKVCVLEKAGVDLLKKAMEKLQLSARAYDRILKVSRTIADLEGSEKIQLNHLAEAIQYRSLDRGDWA